MILFVFGVFNLFLESFIFLLETTHLLIAHSFLLIKLLIEAFILNRCVFFERPPLILKLCNFFLQTLLIHPIAFFLFDGFRQFASYLRDFSRFLLNLKRMLLSQTFDHALVSFLFID